MQCQIWRPFVCACSSVGRLAAVLRVTSWSIARFAQSTRWTGRNHLLQSMTCRKYLQCTAVLTRIESMKRPILVVQPVLPLGIDGGGGHGHGHGSGGVGGGVSIVSPYSAVVWPSFRRPDDDGNRGKVPAGTIGLCFDTPWRLSCRDHLPPPESRSDASQGDHCK